MITEKEEQFRKIQSEYDSFTYMFYESMHNGNYTYDQVCEQTDKLIKEIQEMKKFRVEVQKNEAIKRRLSES